MKKLSLCLLAFVLLFSIAKAYGPILGTKPEVPQLQNTGAVFVENKGQWDSQVRYLTRLDGLNAWVTDKGIVYDFYKIIKGTHPSMFPDDPNLDQDWFTSSTKGHVINLTFDGIANPSFNGIDKKNTYYNYFIGNDPTKWASKVNLYSNVTVASVYQGINARYYFDDSGLRYDMIVNPDGIPEDIQMKLEGSDGYSINENGELVIATSIGEVKQAKLFAYQEIQGEKLQVQCSFKLNSNGNIGFEVGEYNHSYPLIIDPLIWATYLGGAGFNANYSCTMKSDGCYYFGGGSMASNFPVTPGAYQSINGGASQTSMNSIIGKMNFSGSELIFATYLGGNTYDMTFGINVDDSGYVYLSGYAQSPNFPTTPGVFGPTHHGSMDAYATKMTPNGTALIYSTFFGGSGYDCSNLSGIDAAGNAYLLGFSGSSGLPTTPGCFQANYAGGTYDGYVLKINPDATAILLCTYIGGTLSETPQGFGLDAAGNVFGGGYTSSTNFPVTSGAFQTTYGGGTNDGFVFKLSADFSTLLYSTYLGGTGNDQIRPLNIDTAGNAYVGGSTTSPNFPVTPGAFQMVYGGGGNNDGYVTKLNPTGTGLVYSTYIGGALADNTRSIVLSNSGNAYVTGTTSSTDFPITPDAFQTTFQGGGDAVLFMLNSTATTLLYSTYFGGSASDGGGMIASDGMGNAVMSASSYSANFPVTSGAFQQTINGGNPSIILAKWELNPALPSPIPMSPTNHQLFVSLTPTMKWHSVAIATTYDIQISTAQDFSVYVINQTGITDTTFLVPTPLSETTKYYWHTRAHSDTLVSSWSIGWDFVTEGPLAPPVLVSPVNSASGLITIVNFVWQPVLAASSYHLQLSTNSGFTTLLADTTLVATSIKLSSMVNNTVYYWRVMASNADTTSNWSEVWNFKTGNYVTIGTGTTYDTDTYGSPGPYNYYYWHTRTQYLYKASDLIDAGAYPGNIVNFGWNVAVLNASGPMGPNWGIKIKLTTDETITGWDYSGWTEIFSPPTGTTYTPLLGWNIHPVQGEPFFWDGVQNIKVEACYAHPGAYGTVNPDVYYTVMPYNCVAYRIDNSASYNLCDTIETANPTYFAKRPNMKLEFQLMPLMPPVLVTPANHALGISRSPLFTWNTSETATTYQIQAAFTNDFLSTIIDESGLTATSYQATVLLNETTKFYWRVRAYDAAGGVSYWSFTWDFITEGPLAAPVLTAPVNGILHVPTLPVFTWNPAFAATQYHFQLATDAGFTTLIIDNTLTQTTLTPTTELAGATVFYWRVMAQNPFVNSDWSEVWNFTTGNFITIGTGTTYYSSGGNPPGPYGNVWGGVKHQILVTRDELVALGAIPGSITALGFNCFAVNGCAPLQNLTIKAKHTDQTQLSVWDTGEWTEVFSNTLYIPQVGWNIHAFTLPFEWDGASNVLFDVCFNNLTYTSNASLYYTATTNPMTIAYWNDQEPTLCSSPGTPNTMVQRPNMKLDFLTQTFLPPVLTAPANNSLGVSLLPLFTWETVEGASTYEIQASDVSDFSTTAINVSGITGLSYQATTPLTQTTLYYWHVRAVNSSGSSSNWSLLWNFITEGPISSPILLSPDDDLVNAPAMPVFTWLPVLAATNYNFQVSTTSDFSVISTNLNVTVPTVGGIGFALNTQFWWRVMATNPFVNSIWSEVWTFTVGNVAQIGTGTATNLYYNYPTPYGNYNQGNTNEYLFTAQELLDAGCMPGEISSLAFNVANVNSCGPLTNWTIKMKQTSATTINSFELTNLTQVYTNESYQPFVGWNTHTFDTPFIWDGVSSILIDICSNNTGSTQNASVFYTPTANTSMVYYYANSAPTICTAPGTNVSPNRPNIQIGFISFAPILNTPVLTAPANNATGVSVLPTFTWEAVGGASSYKIQVSTSSDFSTLAVNATVTTNSYTPTTNLLNLTSYFWRVRAFSTISFSWWSAPWTFTTLPPSVTQTLNLTNGWNLISSYINPTDPLIANMFASIANNINIMKNTAGQFWIPGVINTITTWNYVEGYQLNMKAASSVGITGLKIVPENTPINLGTGWKYIAYLRDNPKDITLALASIPTANISIVKNSAGGFWIPGVVNTIGNMLPGQGYQMHLKVASVLIYPSNSSMKQGGMATPPSVIYLKPTISNTGNNASLILNLNNIPDGNEIGIWNMNNELIGSGVVYNGIAAVTIWGNDEMTQIPEGAADGELLIAKIYNQNTGTLSEIKLNSVIEMISGTVSSNLLYSRDGVFFAQGNVKDESSEIGLSATPNPFDSKTNISYNLNASSNVQLVITNSLGEEVARLIDNSIQDAGTHSFEFNSGILPSGIYYCTLRTGSSIEVVKLVMLK